MWTKIENDMPPLGVPVVLWNGEQQWIGGRDRVEGEPSETWCDSAYGIGWDAGPGWQARLVDDWRIKRTPPTHWHPLPQPPKAFCRKDSVRKKRGGQWRGKVVGHYVTGLTPEGYAVESEREPGSVQIYPASALEPWDGNPDPDEDLRPVLRCSACCKPLAPGDLCGCPEAVYARQA